ncbi:uncharacterized protein LOC129944332 [Eupeodes corollae]|uniref:uncharacterized protein LOC129944332 n=1 Tax=Eupeodes corollae TaxID=290404 RepID=UPI00248F6FF8|nr:uncharacterized protein LOC129944332 [Eupeodes corollae]
MTAEQQVVGNVPASADIVMEQEQIQSDDVQCALLATACVKVQIRAGQSVEARALLDSGSEVNLVTERCVQKLGISKRYCVFSVQGIGSSIALRLTGMVNVSIRSTIDPSFNLECEMFVVKKITSCLPSRSLSQAQAKEMRELKLADPKFSEPARIEMLLGAQVWAEIIRECIKRFSSGLTAQDSSLGWIVFGKLQPRHERAGKTMCIASEPSDVELNQLLRKFWKIEEPSSGRYVVTIPINPRAAELGSTRAVAMKRFLQTEKRLCAVPELRQKYVDFMREYEELGHMKQVIGPSTRERAYHIPHHCVTKKFRVVFDASCKSVSGVSLNDVQFSGAKLQDDLSAIITRFRCFKIAVSADVEKMFRQVKVNPEQWDLQRIFWRESPNKPMREYRLTVVTYGMASSGFNAVRAMHQCASDDQESYPLAYKAILSNFYMDDMLTGADTQEQATSKCRQIISSLRAGGFKLSKFMSSSQRVLSKLTSTYSSERELTFPEDNNASMLCLVWNCAKDEISFKVRARDERVSNTKRAVVSAIARLYDPNGYLAPVIISAKILIQDLLRSGMGRANTHVHSADMAEVQRAAAALGSNKNSEMARQH